MNTLTGNKLFGVGLSRTGTTSLHQLMLQLGIDSTHSCLDLFDDRFSADLIRHHAFFDLPIPLFYKEYDDRFPDSRFILTLRNEDQWIESMQWLFRHGRVIWHWNSRINRINKLVYGGTRFNETRLRLAYRRHTEEVLSHFKDRPNSLFVLDWSQSPSVATVCEFLGVEQGEISEFPRVNERRDATLAARVLYPLIRCGDAGNSLVRRITSSLKTSKDGNAL